DEHFLDLAYQLARASEAKDGHMGCCVVLRGEIIAMSINCALFGAARSDVHAEAAVHGPCQRRPIPKTLAGASIYVTKAPCINCYKLIAVAGIKRIV
ncbi:cytidine deaminase-like protein, partial [Pelagophyceae sp. CCMP2097]